MQDFAAILRALAWPLVAVYVVYRFQGPLARLLEGAATFFGHLGKLRFRDFGVNLELAADVAKAVVTSPGKDPTRTAESDADEYQRLAREYTDLREPDYAKRVALRRVQADRLGVLAASLRRDRKALASGSPANNPRVPEREEIVSLYRAVWSANA